MIDWAQTLPHPLLAARASRGGAPAIVADDGEWTYERLVQAVRARAAGLQALGVRRDQRIAWTLRQLGDDLVTLHAIGWLGACAAPIARDSRDPERDAEHLGADHFLTSAPDGEPEDAPPASPWPLSQPRWVVATSGTTGTPKVIELTTGQLVFSAMGSAMRLGHLPGDRWLGVLPLHHVGGLSIVMRCLLSASTVELHARFEVERVVEALCSGRVTQISLVPTMLDRIVPRLPQRGASDRLRVVLVGGAKPSRALLEAALAKGLPVAATWGMSETASQAATLEPGVAPTSAPPLPFLEVLCEADRLVVRGPAAAGTVLTNDRGAVDGLGRVRVDGRVDQTIISGGENIDPEAIAAVLRQHPDVLRAYVVGVPDSVYGERPAAALIAGGDRQPSAQELRAFCRESLPRYMVPDRILWLSAEPVNALGKIRFADLKEWLRRVERSEDDGEP